MLFHNIYVFCCFFFFQAEDGIRDHCVTGVQTCALPIFTRMHGLDPKKAGLFFGGTLVVAGLVSTFVGGFAATAWQRRNPAGYAWMLGLSTLAAVPVALGAFLTGNLTLAMVLLALSMLLLFLSTGPVNTLILETVPANMRATA